MEQSKPKRIEEISIPDSLKKELITIKDAMMKTFQKNAKWDFTCGYLPRPELDYIPDIYWETFCFMTEINEVIENLNLVITELSFLTTYPELWRLPVKSRLSKKYTLLVRTFFL
ncbi:MAG: hypothetical protein SCARUB_02167 [Candidatus Scalindua rubra]|uniref:Uncharacterized protein n=1 Tax=Candidatus Scalindua rubra TaxID=1872076 RepID=A0A1E3XAQ3_9BACT|nr:MAG: hypothetical protein SCARUB_02167 [Candidatus Scalindua rubra]